MAYNNNIPQPTDQISQSQADILANFQALNPLIIGVVDFPTSLATPAPTGNNTIYSQLYATTGLVELFIRNAANTTQIPFTASQTAVTYGWTYLPSGMLLVWGQGTILAGNATKTIVYTSVPGFPGFTTNSVGLSLTRIHNATSTNFTQIDSFNGTQFIARRSTSTTSSADDFTFFAVGR